MKISLGLTCTSPSSPRRQRGLWKLWARIFRLGLDSEGDSRTTVHDPRVLGRGVATDSIIVVPRSDRGMHRSNVACCTTGNQQRAQRIDQSQGVEGLWVSVAVLKLSEAGPTKNDSPVAATITELMDRRGEVVTSALRLWSIAHRGGERVGCLTSNGMHMGLAEKACRVSRKLARQSGKGVLDRVDASSTRVGLS